MHINMAPFTLNMAPFALALALLLVLFRAAPIHSTTVLPDSSTAVRTITDENWKQILVGEWLVKFYAPWCPACRAMHGTWAEVGAWANTQDISIGAVDVTQQTALNGRFLISSLPTIYHIRDGEFRVYDGSRSAQDFTSFLLEAKWKKLDPVPSWKSPNGPLMGGVSSVYGLSVHLKDLHEQLSGGYGFPQWMVILLFVVGIISLGLILGFVMVFIGDWMWPEPEYIATMRATVKPKEKKPDPNDGATGAGDTDDDRQTDDADLTSTEERISLTDEEEILKNVSEPPVAAADADAGGMELRQRKMKSEEDTS